MIRVGVRQTCGSGSKFEFSTTH